MVAVLAGQGAARSGAGLGRRRYTLRHLQALGGIDQRVLFGEVASASAACRTVAALADDELAVARLDAARRDIRQRAWEVGGARRWSPPAKTIRAASAARR